MRPHTKPQSHQDAHSAVCSCPNTKDNPARGWISAQGSRIPVTRQFPTEIAANTRNQAPFSGARPRYPPEFTAELIWTR